MDILQICAYAADYPGNFIASLLKLEEMMMNKGYRTLYAFPERAREKDWCKELSRRTSVYFLPEARARIKPETYHAIKKIYKNHDIRIVHSHFELYDIPCTVTAPKNVKVFWHLHDPIGEADLLHHIMHKIQYGIVGRKVTLISVSEFYRDYVVKLGFPMGQSCIVKNGIDLDRLKANNNAGEKKYDFLTFGWDFYRKGDDIIIQAMDLLKKEGYRFKFLLNGNQNTWKKLDEFLNGDTRDYIVCAEGTTDIRNMFDQSAVFIQASRKETFSFAVCEAVYYGLPVISSDIYGLEWAKEIPSIAFFESENVEDLSQIMKRFLNGHKVSNEDLLKGKEIVIQKYSLDVWVDHIINVYGLNH